MRRCETPPRLTMKLIRLTFLLFALAATGCVSKSPRWISAPPAQRAVAEPPPLRAPEPIRLWKLMPEATSVPAVLKGKKQDIVSGEYSYASFQDLLRLIGRIQGVSHEVLAIRFLEGFAASVEVDGWILKCMRPFGGEWQIVGANPFSADSGAKPPPTHTHGWQHSTSGGRMLLTGEQLYWNLMPEATSRPATLHDRALVSGEYSNVQLQAVLRLIGRIPRVEHEVYFITFFKHFAASVRLHRWEFHCAMDLDGHWQIVGFREFSH